MLFRIFEEWHLHKNGVDLGNWFVQQVLRDWIKFYQPDTKSHLLMGIGDGAFRCKLVRRTPFKW